MQRSIPTQVQDIDLVSERRKRIVDAAIVVFRRKGFHAATTRMIADEAQITQSNIYNYVRNKDDILYLVCERLVGLYSEGVARAIATHSDPYTRLIEALRAVIDVMFNHREELVLLYNETHALEKADRKLILKAVARFIKQFQDLLDTYVASAGPLRMSNRRLAANLLTFVPAIIALRWWDLSLYSDRAESNDAIFGFILGGLGVPSPPNT
jgi:AcrR family transcriptional regulator